MPRERRRLELIEDPPRRKPWETPDSSWQIGQPVRGAPDVNLRPKRRAKGTGSLWFRAADGRWIGEITVGGERHVVSSTDYDEADRRLLELAGVLRVRAGTRPPAPADAARWAERPLTDYARWWINARRDRIRPVTLRGYARILENQVLPVIGHLVLGDIGQREAFEPVRRGEERGLAPNSLRNLRNTLHGVFAQAVRDGAIPSNPAAGIEVRAPAVDGSRVQLDAGDVDAVLDAIGEGDTPGDLGQLAYYTGARIGELVVLRWTDVHWRRPALRIERTETLDEQGRRTIGETKTERSRRSIPLSVAAVELLERRWADAGKPAAGLIFPSRYDPDKPAQPTWITKIIGDRTEAATGRRLSAHKLRHLAATAMLSGDATSPGMDALTVSRVLGHSTPATTLRIYSGTNTSREREAVARLGRRRRRDTPQE